MSAISLRKASRQKTKMRVALAGPSGSGKTYSALLMASGMTSWDKIALIDTENGSGDLYAHLGDYSVVTLQAPFTPERYIQAIDACEQAGMEVIIIDSMSHEWDGKGGVLEIVDQLTSASKSKNSYFVWGKVTPRHNAFIDRILASSAHVIVTMRAKQDYVLTERNGKQVPEKVGLKAITREGVDYEFTLAFDLNIDHYAIATKDRTSIFMDPTVQGVNPEKVSVETGKKILDWTQQGTEPVQPTPAERQQPPKEQAAAPAKQTQPEQKPQKKQKPTLTKVFETFGDCKSVERINAVYEQAIKYDWTDKEKTELAEARDKHKERIEDTIARAEREGMKVA